MIKKSKKSVLEIITSQIIESLESGHVPWGESWGNKRRPKNFLTGHEFTGFNLMLLTLNKEFSNLWAPRGQLIKAGIQIKKGSRGQVALRVDDDDKLRFFKVFNIDQCELTEQEKKEFFTDYKKNDFKFLEEIYSTMQSTPNINLSGDHFSYCPNNDQLNLNLKDPNLIFKFAHELIHSTGHSQRLHRNLLEEKEFSEIDFSFEELIADIGSYYLLSDLGKDFNFKENKDYAATWGEVIKENPMYLIKACSAASKAVDYIQGIENNTFEKMEIETENIDETSSQNKNYETENKEEVTEINLDEEEKTLIQNNDIAESITIAEKKNVKQKSETMKEIEEEARKGRPILLTRIIDAQREDDKMCKDEKKADVIIENNQEKDKKEYNSIEAIQTILKKIETIKDVCKEIENMAKDNNYSTIKSIGYKLASYSRASYSAPDHWHIDFKEDLIEELIKETWEEKIKQYNYPEFIEEEILKVFGELEFNHKNVSKLEKYIESNADLFRQKHKKKLINRVKSWAYIKSWKDYKYPNKKIILSKFNVSNNHDLLSDLISFLGEYKNEKVNIHYISDNYKSYSWENITAKFYEKTTKIELNDKALKMLR